MRFAQEAARAFGCIDRSISIENRTPAGNDMSSEKGETSSEAREICNAGSLRSSMSWEIPFPCLPAKVNGDETKASMVIVSLHRPQWIAWISGKHFIDGQMILRILNCSSIRSNIDIGFIILTVWPVKFAWFALGGALSTVTPQVIESSSRQKDSGRGLLTKSIISWRPISDGGVIDAPPKHSVPTSPSIREPYYTGKKWPIIRLRYRLEIY